MKFYRYDLITNADYPFVTVYLLELNLHKETPKGYWIYWGNWYNGFTLRKHAKWVSKTGLKRYAYPTKEEALNSFIKRQEKREKILEQQLHDTRLGLTRAKFLSKVCIDCEGTGQFQILYMPVKICETCNGSGLKEIEIELKFTKCLTCEFTACEHHNKCIKHKL